MLLNFSDNTSAEISGLQNNLALVLQDLGDYQSAKSLLEKAVLSDEKNLRKDHPNTAVSYSNLALVIKDLSDYQNALELSEMALATFKKALPECHPNIETVNEICQSIKNEIK